MEDSNWSHVLWLGGTSCCGKSTISKILSEQYNLNVHHIDDFIADHSKRIIPTQHPASFRWASSVANGITKYDAFVYPEADFIEQFSSIGREDFLLTIEDLAVLPKDKPLLVEGTRLPPVSLYPLLSDTRNAIWLVPSMDFLRTHVPERKHILEAMQKYPDPQGAFENALMSNLELGRYFSESAIKLGLKALTIDNNQSIDDTVEIISRHFRLQ